MEAIIEKFYTSFAKLDVNGMLSCYHEEIIFEDPAFGKLRGAKARNMWKMLCDSQDGKDFVIEHANIKHDGEVGSADWEARYTFSKTGRKVHNIIRAEFKFKDGKIIQHTDHFDLYRWSRQAMGVTGVLIGWAPFFKKQLQQRTNRMLLKYITINEVD